MGRYISLAYANSYISPNPRVGSQWDALTDDQKNDRIEYYEREMDHVPWIGNKVDTQQYDEFPRDLYEAAYNYDKWTCATDELQLRIKQDDGNIPERFREAICEYIIYYYESKNFQKLLDLQDVNVKSFSSAGTSFNFEKDKGRYPLPNRVWRLCGYLTQWWWLDNPIVFTERV